MSLAIAFDEAQHKYRRRGTEYISVTTLIHRYCEPFDGEYWSVYKAVKDVLSKYHEWQNFKWSCGGWENVVGTYNSRKVKPHWQEVQARKQYYLDKWAEAGRIARDKGTKVHKDLEDEINDSISIKHEGGEVMIPTPGVAMHDPLTQERNAVIAEPIVFNDRYQIAGMVDRVDKRGQVIDITDHKTSKEITKVAFMDKVLLDPVQHIPDANYYVYSLQLSLYAWMLEQFGYKIGKLQIGHRNRETGELIEMYPVSYLKKDIELILMHYDAHKK